MHFDMGNRLAVALMRVVCGNMVPMAIFGIFLFLAVGVLTHHAWCFEMYGIGWEIARRIYWCLNHVRIMSPG